VGAIRPRGPTEKYKKKSSGAGAKKKKHRGKKKSRGFRPKGDRRHGGGMGGERGKNHNQKKKELLIWEWRSKAFFIGRGGKSLMEERRTWRLQVQAAYKGRRGKRMKKEKKRKKARAATTKKKNLKSELEIRRG